METELAKEERELLRLIRDFWDEDEWVDDVDLAMNLGWSVHKAKAIGRNLTYGGYLEGGRHTADFGWDFKLTDKGRAAL